MVLTDPLRATMTGNEPNLQPKRHKNRPISASERPCSHETSQRQSRLLKVAQLWRLWPKSPPVNRRIKKPFLTFVIATCLGCSLLDAAQPLRLFTRGGK